MMYSLNNNTSIQSLSQSLNSSFAGMYKSLQKLSSGMKINSASDGPAQLLISEQLRTQIASLNQQIENRYAQMSTYNTASSNLNILRSQLTDIRTTALGAANESGNSDATQKAYSDSADLMVSNFNLVLNKAEFNGQVLFDGSEGSVASIADLSGLSFTTADEANASIDILDAKISEIDSVIVDIGSYQKNEIESDIAQLRISRENLLSAEQNIRSTDFATEYTNFVVEQMKAKVGLALMSHYAMTSKSVLSIFNQR